MDPLYDAFMRDVLAVTVLALAACGAPPTPMPTSTAGTGAPCGAASSAAGPTGAAGRWAKVDAIAAAEAENHALAGLAIGIAYQGKVVFTKGYGFEDREAKIPVDPETTLFRWASVSKTVTGVLTAALVHDGVIGFDDPATKHYAGFAPKAFVERCTEKTRTNARGTFPCKDGFADIPLRPGDGEITIGCGSIATTAVVNDSEAMAS